jgi:hypothetical protein
MSSIQEREGLLQVSIEQLKRRGWKPDAFVISDDGDTTAGQSLANMEKAKIELWAIFIREDGYALGCPKEFKQTAQAIYEGQWLGYIQRKNSERGTGWWWQASVLEQSGLEMYAGAFTLEGAPVDSTAELPPDRSIEGIRYWLRRGGDGPR